ncbi:FtsK/SpoIIIE domain-containing protein [Bifidobacterium moraviense]|nr:FtsK/SpoIIIE domain-containing protein [Bifidobacterium sp. DSM 109958]
MNSRTRRERRHDPDRSVMFWMLMSMAAPACAQLAMAVAMAAEGRWTFAVMMLPGLIGCIASFMLMRARRVRTDEPRTTSVTGDDAAGRAVTPMRSPSWTDVMGFGDDALSTWRRTVSRWLSERERAAVPGPVSQPAAIGIGIGDADADADGMDAGGASAPVVRFDLAAHGPHALVAGTTGSGKSALLIQWCLSLAVAHPPSRLVMVFLDFKGGATFRELERLPHAVGCVSDLDLDHAVRALNAIERELERRERLVAEAGVGQMDDMPDPPARLLVVVDEFNALRERLPDAVGRLTRLASLGRSLGMNLIACTQHPMGQVNAAMKANIALNVCLRVRDALQSSEMLGTGAAASIPPSMPGYGFGCDGGEAVPFRCVGGTDVAAVVDGIVAAAATCEPEPVRRLFSAPLPRTLPPPPAGLEPEGMAMRIGMWDDGVMIRPCDLPWREGVSIIVAAGRSRGKSTALARLSHELDRLGIPYAESLDDVPASAGAESAGRRVLVLDDADELLDPYGSDPRAARLAAMLTSRSVTVVAAVSSCRRLPDEDRFPVRIVMPTGDRATDLMAGIPAAALAQLGDDGHRIAGRAVLLDRGSARVVQLCHG